MKSHQTRWAVIVFFLLALAAIPAAAAVPLQINYQGMLTDADDPKLQPWQLEKIHRRATGITIHAVEFGSGPQSQSENFLTRLAEQNGGKHAYVDISKLSLPPRP